MKSNVYTSVFVKTNLRRLKKVNEIFIFLSEVTPGIRDDKLT